MWTWRQRCQGSSIDSRYFQKFCVWLTVVDWVIICWYECCHSFKIISSRFKISNFWTDIGSEILNGKCSQRSTNLTEHWPPEASNISTIECFFELENLPIWVRFGINFLGLISNNFLYSCEFWILFQDKKLIPMMVFLPKFPYLLSLHFWWIRSHLKLSSVKSSNSDDLPKIPIAKNLTVVDFEFVKTRLESKFSNGHFVITSILQCWIENIKSDDDVTWVGLCTAISQFYTLILSSTTKWFWTMKPADFIEQWTEKSLQFLICYRLHKMSGKKTGNFDDGKIVNRSLFWIFRIVTRSFNIPIHQWNAKFDFSRTATNGAKDWNCWLWHKWFNGTIFWLLKGKWILWEKQIRVRVKFRVKLRWNDGYETGKLAIFVANKGEMKLKKDWDAVNSGWDFS